MKGKGFIVNADGLISNQKKGKRLFNLKSNDCLSNVVTCNQSHVAVTNKSGKLLIFEVKSIPILQKGVGVQLIKIKEKDFLSDLQLVDIQKGIFWQVGSKKRSLSDIKFWIGKRAQSGKKVPKFFNKNFKFYD